MCNFVTANRAPSVVISHRPAICGSINGSMSSLWTVVGKLSLFSTNTLHVHPHETLTVQMFEVHLVRRCVRMLQVHRQTFLASMLSPVAVKTDNMYVPANKERINYKILHERILAVFGFVFLTILICSSNVDSP